MNRKTLVVLLLLASVVLAGVPGSLARPQYLTNLTAVYGGGSCGTCHIMPTGQRDFNGQHNFSNGSYVPRNRTGQRNTNRTFEMRNSNRTFPLNSYGILFGNQPDHATDPGAALMAIGQPPADTPATNAPAAAPGFGFIAALVGLFACVLLARRYNK